MVRINGGLQAALRAHRVDPWTQQLAKRHCNLQATGLPRGLGLPLFGVNFIIAILRSKQPSGMTGLVKVWVFSSQYVNPYSRVV